MKFPTLTSAALALASLSDAASLQQVTNWGNNPSGIRAYIYVPDKLAANPALIVAVRLPNITYLFSLVPCTNTHASPIIAAAVLQHSKAIPTHIGLQQIP